MSNASSGCRKLVDWHLAKSGPVGEVWDSREKNVIRCNPCTHVGQITTEPSLVERAPSCEAQVCIEDQRQEASSQVILMLSSSFDHKILYIFLLSNHFATPLLSLTQARFLKSKIKSLEREKLKFVQVKSKLDILRCADEIISLRQQLKKAQTRSIPSQLWCPFCEK